MNAITPPGLDEKGKPGRARIHLREIAEGDAGPLETVGQQLRAARLRRGDDFATVSRQLRISKTHLAALESNEIDTLPARAYAVGFVRSYAAYLGLDAAACAERFKIETGGQAENAPRVGPAPEAYRNRLPRGWALMAVIVIGVVIYGAFHITRSASVSSPGAVAPVPARITSVLTAHPQPGHGSTPQLSGPLKASGSQTAATGATPAVLAPVTATPPAQLQPPPSEVTPGRVYGARNQHVRLVLHATAPTRVLVQSRNGKVYLNRILQPGDLYRVPDLVGLSLTTSVGAAVSLELDGQNMGNAGSPGAPSTALSLDPQAIVDRSGGRTPG